MMEVFAMVTAIAKAIPYVQKILDQFVEFVIVAQEAAEDNQFEKRRRKRKALTNALERMGNDTSNKEDRQEIIRMLWHVNNS